MEHHIIISRIKTLLTLAPSFDTYSPASHEHLMWLAQAYALVNRWNSREAISVKSASELLSVPMMRDHNIAKIFGTLHRAVAELELSLPVDAGQAFGPGAVYDFFRALNDLVASASATLFVIDSYIDDTVFDAYLTSVTNGVQVRLLAGKTSANLKQAVEKFKAQHGVAIEVRVSRDFHDRVVFIDEVNCWVLGQSIKDAAKSKPTYLAPLSPDVAIGKFAQYQDVWNRALAL